MMKMTIRALALGLLVMQTSGFALAHSMSQGWIRESDRAPRHKQNVSALGFFDVIKEVRVADVALTSVQDDQSIEKQVLDTALQILKRNNPFVDYKLTLRNRFDSKVIQNQEYFQFSQMQGGFPMEGLGISVMTVLNERGRVVRLVSSSYQPPTQPDKNQVQFLMDSRVFELAEKELGGFDVPLFKNRMIWSFIEGQWHLVRQMQKTGQPKVVSVDVYSGQVFTAEHRHEFDAVQSEGAVVAKGTFSGPVIDTATATDLQMPFLKLNVDSGAAIYSDAAGKFKFAPSSQKLLANFEGKFVTVNTETGKAISLSVALDPKKTQYSFPVALTDEIAAAQSNAYFHVNRIHSYLDSHAMHDPGFDKMVGATVNINDSCNAYYDGGVVHFFKSGGDSTMACANTAFDTVIYHEYGHLVDDSYGGIGDGGLSEGWGDVMAMFITGIPEIGKDFFTKGGRADQNYIRTGENTYQYPADGNDEVHSLGQAWSGFSWLLRKSLIAKYGQEKGIKLAEDLILPSLPSNAMDTPSCVREVLARDSSSANLMTAPDYAEIFAAAQAHSLDSFLKIN